MSEIQIAQNLIGQFLDAKSNYNYINLSADNKYLGWVTNFNIYFSDGNPMALDLRKENDLFLLFVLAIAWSRTGPWENAAYLVTYLKSDSKDYPEYWLNLDNVNREIAMKGDNAVKIVKNVSGCQSRKKVSFREDIFLSINILAKHWQDIKNKLEFSNETGEYLAFMYYLRDIEGLGVNSKRIFIKIPLILRELRCQNIYDNIPGELCCVPDARVKEACKDLGIKLPTLTTDIDTLLKVSKRIYELFGDLYDLPLFAYEDIK